MRRQTNKVTMSSVSSLSNSRHNGTSPTARDCKFISRDMYEKNVGYFLTDSSPLLQIKRIYTTFQSQTTTTTYAGNQFRLFIQPF